MHSSYEEEFFSPADEKMSSSGAQELFRVLGEQFLWQNDSGSARSIPGDI